MTDTAPKPFEQADIDAIFLVWSKPQGSHRSQYLADLFGMTLHNVYFLRGRGFFYAALKYPVQAIMTIFLLFRERPQLVFIQDPPTPAALVVWFCSLFLPLQYVIDIHTQRKLLVDYDFLWGMRRFVSKRALVNIVTNDHLAEMLENMHARAIVMEDPPLPIADDVLPKQLEDDFSVIWINVAGVDEPSTVVRTVAETMPHVTFYITGDYDRSAGLRAFQQTTPSNMIFTGYLPDEDYYQLLVSVDVAMTLTTRDHTLQQGACEAMWLGRPVITSDWQMLRDYFVEGAVFVDNTVVSIVQAIETIQADHATYTAQMTALQSYHRHRWQAQVQQFLTLFQTD